MSQMYFIIIIMSWFVKTESIMVDKFTDMRVSIGHYYQGNA